MTVFSEDVYDLLDAQILHLEPTPKPLTYKTTPHSGFHTLV